MYGKWKTVIKSIYLNEALTTLQKDHVICLPIHGHRKKDPYKNVTKEGGNKVRRIDQISPLFVSYRAAA